MKITTVDCPSCGGKGRCKAGVNGVGWDICLDCDGDRTIMVDENGNRVYPGEEIPEDDE